MKWVWIGIQKNLHFEGLNAYKKFKKDNFKKKTEGILLWDITNWFWGKTLFCHLIYCSCVALKVHSVFCKRKLISQKPNKFKQLVQYLQRKNQQCILILSVLFCSETEALYFLHSWNISRSIIGAFWWIFSKNVPHNITWKWECRPGT